MIAEFMIISEKQVLSSLDRKIGKPIRPDVVTHNLVFHLDDCITIAMLILMYPKITICRSRDPRVWKLAKFKIDVGGLYNPTTGDYDHHQRDFNLTHPEGSPWSAAGAFWDEHGERIVSIVRGDENFVHSNELAELAESVRKRLILSVDMGDNGKLTFRPEQLPLKGMIFGMNPQTFEDYIPDAGSFDLRFQAAVHICLEVLYSQIQVVLATRWAKKEILDRAFLCDGPILEFPSFLAGWQHTLNQNPDTCNEILYVMYPEEDLWIAMARPELNHAPGERDPDYYFPRSWGGLEGSDLQQASGIEGLTMVHEAGFIVKGTKEAVLFACTVMNRFS